MNFHCPSKISLWNRIRLFFRPTLQHIDYSERLVLHYKRMDGVFYLLSEEKI